MSSIGLPPFLTKLQTLTSECNPSIAGWNRHGTEFHVHRSSQFEKEVLKKHFKGSKSTFIRQLHFYCFKKLDNKGADSWAFSHPKFLRDAPHMVYEIRRKTRTETAGPASKDEVQALRTEMARMRKEMTGMRDTFVQQIQQLTQQVNSLRQTGPQTSSSSPTLLQQYGKAKVLHDYSPGKRARDSDQDSDDSMFLPFEDDSAMFYPKENLTLSVGPMVDEKSDAKKAKLNKELDSEFTGAGMEDFSDLFLGLVNPWNEAGNSSPFSVSSSSSSSSQATVPADTPMPPATVPKASSCLLAAAPVKPEITQVSDCKVLMTSASKSIEMPNPVFAGFLSKFVEHSVMLHSRNMLTGELDAELEIFVHASLPRDCPLKELLAYAPSHVRTVLVNVLSEVSSSTWQCGSSPCTMSSTPSTVEFMKRPILVFKFPEGQKEIKGECFLQFLSFLMRAAINDNPAEPATTQPNKISPFFAIFSKYFTPQVTRIMSSAHAKIEEYKVRMGTVNACPTNGN